MASKRDWKYWLMFAVTVLGIAAPFWLWQKDLDSKSLKLRIATVPLIQSAGSKLELKVLYGDEQLTSPVLSVLELTNRGARPIVTSDFDTPITLKVGKETAVRRASVESTVPSSLAPTLTVVDGAVQIKPLLLNPGDSFSIAILTDGDLPVFKPDVRVAGVKDIEVEMSEPERKASRLKSRLLSIASIPLVGLYMAFAMGAFVIDLPAWARIYGLGLAASCAILSMGNVSGLLEILGINKSHQHLGTALMLLLSVPVSAPLMLSIWRARGKRLWFGRSRQY